MDRWKFLFPNDSTFNISPASEISTRGYWFLKAVKNWIGVKSQNTKFFHERSSCRKNYDAEMLKNIVLKLSTKIKYIIIT